MLGPKTENKVEDGDGNTQVGHNSGTMNVGLTFEQHQTALKEAVAQKAVDLERAHGAEKALIQRELAELQGRFSNVEADYQERLGELEALKRKLAAYDNQVPREKLDAAYAALDRDDTSLAEALFEELLLIAAARTEDAAKDEAEICFQLGKIAEGRVEWAEAASHFARAAELLPNFDNLSKARDLSTQSGLLGDAFEFGQILLEGVRQSNDPDLLANALNGQGLTLHELGKNREAKAHYLEALSFFEDGKASDPHARYHILVNLAGALDALREIVAAEELLLKSLDPVKLAFGEVSREYGNILNSLGMAYESQRRYDEAEKLLKRSLTLGRRTIGDSNPEYADRLSNLGVVFRKQKRFKDAERVYRKAIAIDLATNGPMHPKYALHLGNLALLLPDMGRLKESEKCHREALNVLRVTFGTEHTFYREQLISLSIVIANLGRLDESNELLKQGGLQ